jgi:hypothetical protein
MVVLNDLLAAADFPAAVDALAADFRRAHHLPPIHQLGLVTPSAETAAAELEARGIGPFFIAAGAPVLWRERGQDRRFAGKLALAYHRGYELEPLEPGEGSDFYRRSLDPAGRTVVQHLGMLVSDVDDWAQRMERAGFPVWVRGRLKSGPLVTDFAYLDTEAEAGLVIEFIRWTVFGREFSPPPKLIHAIGRLQRWSGKRCLKM